MRISVIGCGYLGAVHAACMAKLGHDVVGIDLDEKKISALAAGKAPFYEPVLDDLLVDLAQSGRLRFTTDIQEARGCEVHFICVGTPQKRGENAADLKFVDAAVHSLAGQLSPGDVVAGKSTVPVGTAARLAEIIKDAEKDAHLAWNPEFLREGHAVSDTLSPDRFVYGVEDGNEDHPAVRVLDHVYETALSTGTPRLITDFATAELVKTAANSFLATKISFINAMAEVCEAAGADVTRLADAIGLDDRIGRKFLNAGIGFGGGCLPKDIRAFMARAGELGADQALTFLREVDAINMRRRTRVVEVTRELCGGTLMGQRIAVLGAAFKPESDDVRDSPALSAAAQLQLQGAVVTVTDPQALSNAAKRFPELQMESDLESTLQHADAVLLLTEWKEYRDLDPHTTGALVASRRILDGRNVLDPAKWRAAGWTYRGMGRP
ncbi:UDP-glucose/GDP-mannose dehydrogenase family protein [Arthrobacter sp. AL08]|uniref:UDP-glucose dehydrogenase family protein n=1 Tax=Micrococcaceae TaxID=1268 RepID=UPI001CFFF5B5|nr:MULTISPECIES: UDP-glucose/GDP-mannose dehydrogenase family protein [Micrococcaceae]MCB5280975.1 UDP-glucose 6-dehydrogenase [Arthrobacter sp. ES1]MDD1478308.1 UDP-glucose/GDP-mannose dehydrogenase family protein [Arthrobacter sp. H16F315]MDI3240578.1 UDP-glucose/GDP-mannose dehydrogenase family protein [Arthrobacter sp. AL05]MDI3276588.1 UDP-glucose/GDP-mannose dehydrogenase family protein [Arthrobacter sp. AL08]MDJ0352042.1 UDP-glucose/GDP-mannose dehydrogenase family protein [Pseudarthrob